jgi:hypothetical protein
MRDTKVIGGESIIEERGESICLIGDRTIVLATTNNIVSIDEQ